MSQSSSGLPDIPSPESPSLYEKGLLPDPAITNSETKMDTSQTVTAEQLSCNDFLFGHPAPRRLTDPTPEHLLYFEVLLKEAAALMAKVQKHQSAANNINAHLGESFDDHRRMFKEDPCYMHIHRHNCLPSTN
ncbi:hypothetical protein CDAR_275491 [Caerostris darwini]|uniref:Uncharacterized protein n=1 Tax=Caerostris darwini TaxID=1538125 RepID=A0AAV4UML0_9ARAC|nr:hypothetical protein CDAR_275491 [Caerostris darwini]